LNLGLQGSQDTVDEPVERVLRQCTADRYFAATRAARAIKELRDDEAEDIAGRISREMDVKAKFEGQEERMVRRKMYEETVKLIPAPLHLRKGKEAKA
jgi:hypothetical protein